MNAVNTILNSHPAHQQQGTEPKALQKARQAALKQFSETGFPTIKVEEWKYTSTKALQETGFEIDTSDLSPVSKPAILDDALDASATLVFVNGRLHREWSVWPTHKSLTITELDQKESPLLQSHSDAFSTLNLAFLQDAVHLQVNANAVLDAPIHLIFMGQASRTPICSHPRVSITAGKGSSCTVIQTHIGQGDAPAWINAVVHTDVQANASVRHYVIHRGGENLHYVGNMRADVARDGAYRSHTFWFGGQLARNDLSISLNAPGAETDLFGLYLGGGNEHLDNHTVVEHRAPHCRSNELYKGVLAGAAKAVFNGRIVVHKDAQKTESQQANRNMLLSERATINTKPELEIYADDVTCAHGTTVGQMDEDALFYLRSRGVGVENAKVILTHAFCLELLNSVPDDTLREQLKVLIDETLSRLTRGLS